MVLVGHSHLGHAGKQTFPFLPTFPYFFRCHIYGKEKWHLWFWQSQILGVCNPGFIHGFTSGIGEQTELPVRPHSFMLTLATLRGMFLIPGTAQMTVLCLKHYLRLPTLGTSIEKLLIITILSARGQRLHHEFDIGEDGIGTLGGTASP